MKSNKKVSSNGGPSYGIPPYPKIYVRSPPQHRRYQLMRKTSLEPLQPVLSSPTNESNQPATSETGYNQNTREPKGGMRKVRSRSSPKSLQKVMTWNCQSSGIEKPDQFPISEDFDEFDERKVPEVVQQVTSLKKIGAKPKCIHKAMTDSNVRTIGHGNPQKNEVKAKGGILQKTGWTKSQQLKPATNPRRVKTLRQCLPSRQKVMDNEMKQVRDALSPNFEAPRPRMSPVSVAGRAKLKSKCPTVKGSVRTKPNEAKFKNQFSNSNFPRTVSELRTKTVNIGPRSIERKIKSDQRFMETKPDNPQPFDPSSYRRKFSNHSIGPSHAFITATSLPPFEAQSGNGCESDKNTPRSTSSRRDSEGGYCPGGSSSSDFENDPMLVKLTNEAERFSRMSKQRSKLDMAKNVHQHPKVSTTEEQENLHLKMLEEQGKKLQPVKSEHKARREWNNSVDAELKAPRCHAVQPKVADTPSHLNMAPKLTGEKNQRPETPLTRIYGTVSSNVVHYNTYRDRRIVANQAAQNGHLYSWIKNAKPTYSRVKQLQDFKKHQAFKAFKINNML